MSKVSKVSKDMVSAVRMARWEEWVGLAKDMPAGHHVLSVELLRPQRDETAVVLTVVHDQRVVQYEFRADAMGRNPRPVVSKQLSAVTHLELAAEDGGSVANGIALGEPPPKEPPLPGVIALGTALLTTTFHLGEQAIPDDAPKS